MNKYPEELEADFQQYYAIDLDRVFNSEGTSYSATHLACLAVQLPQTSRTLIAENEDMSWTTETMILADIANSLRIHLASMSKGKKKPDLILPPSKNKKQDTERKLGAQVMNKDELDRILSMKRGE